jgi:hypothetical protein
MKNVLIFISFSLLSLTTSAQTFTQEINIPCGDTAYIGTLGYPTWNPADIVQRAAYGHSSLLGDFVEANLLQYIAPPCFTGLDTVIIKCARATQITCDTGIYVFNIGCEESIATVYSNEVDCRDSIYVNNLSGWFAPAILDSAQFGRSYIVLEPTDGAGVFYQPEPGFEGLDVVKVTLGIGGNQDTLLYLFRVYCSLISDTNDPAELRPIVWPNPVSDWLFIQDVDLAPASLRLWNVQGQVVNVQWDRSNNALQTTMLPSGIYFLKGYTTDAVPVQVRFVKM